MLQLLIFILSTVGLTMIVTESTLFAPVRELAKKLNPGFLGRMFSCPMCFGTWAGWLVQGVMVWSLGQEFKVYHFFYGFIGSICSWYMIVIIDFIEENCIQLTRRGEQELKNLAAVEALKKYHP